MKEQLQGLLQRALEATAARYGVRLEGRPVVQLEHTRDKGHGDFASNLALAQAKAFGDRPQRLAAQLIERITEELNTDAAGHVLIEKVEAAGPGFINFYLRPEVHRRIIPAILTAGAEFGRSDYGQGKKILLEFVSANPTGPLHIGHGRGAAYGDTLARLLRAVGYEVSCEYYINDAGRQMDILALSIWLKYLARCGHAYPYPANAYQADYIDAIAAQLYARDKRKYVIALDGLTDQGGEAQLDQLIGHAREQLGTEAFQDIIKLGLRGILANIRKDLDSLGVRFDSWFSERSLSNGSDGDQIAQAIAQLTANGAMYDKDGAAWFAAGAYGDEKDRVVRRENGAYTYFAADIAYHANKMQRGFDTLINIWGADHHGYIQRMLAAVQALGEDPARLRILLVQFATLYRGGEQLAMSTRAGQYVTLRELIEEVGADAARFFYVMRKAEQHLDFDLDLARAQSNDNPVYYIQYAHARICSVFNALREKDYRYDQPCALENLNLLDNEHELALLGLLGRYPQQLTDAAAAHEPHALCFFLRELAQHFHSYYNSHQFLARQAGLRNARLALVKATQQVLQNGLAVLGVSAPPKM